MSDNKITQDQLEPNVMEELESGIGDLSTLSTENKDSLVAAVTEIYGKNVIAEAIGEPLAVTDTFSEMGSEINSLLSSFKTNMMNSGVTVESGDKFKQLIDKIKGLTEGEGNKGIQFAEGTYSSGSFNAGKTISSTNITFNTTLDFVPTILFLEFNDITYNSNTSSFRGLMSNITPNRFSVTGPGNTVILITNVSNNGCTIGPESTTTAVNTTCTISFPENRYFAIGVGEEDTTLRDSLASILEEKGVDVTEEDDMASLIGKVDEEFSSAPEVNPNAETAICMYCSPGKFETYKTGAGGLLKTIVCNNPEITTVEIVFSLYADLIATTGGGQCQMVLKHIRGGTVINTITKTREASNSSVLGLYPYSCTFDNVQFGDEITITHSIMNNTPSYLSGYGNGILVFYRANI